MTARNRGLRWKLGTSQDMDAAAEAGYQMQVSDEAEDPDWDAFVARAAGGHHVQTSLWGQVKALLGWRAVRVMVRREGDIVAGGQLLMRPLPIGGAVGYVSKGPLLALDDPLLADLVIGELGCVGRANHLKYLVVQPPRNGEGVVGRLLSHGFRSALTEVGTLATVVLDLSRELDSILAAMRRNTRRNIRLGKRRGITVREGTERDLDIYYRLLVATSLRLRFRPYSREYFLEMWRAFSPHGWIKVFMAEYEGEVVSAQLAIPFGDTVISKMRVWSGCHGKRRPNELLVWTAIEWAKSHGYRYYDLGGIEPEAAQAILQGECLPDSLESTATSFKLGFGGQVTLLPEAYDYVYDPFLRWIYRNVFPIVTRQSIVGRALNRFSGRWKASGGRPSQGA